MVHDRQEIRIEVAQARTGHGAEYARMQVAGTRPEQDAGVVPQFAGRSIICGCHGSRGRFVILERCPAFRKLRRRLPHPNTQGAT